MNLLRSFERKVAEAFGEAPQGYTAPFSFRKLAKQAAREMEAETFVIDGVDTAPALYTILVSPEDDAAMRLLYPQLTQEIVTFICEEAQRKGYELVGMPLARFMVDPSLRNGRFALFAENVDAVTLRRLRKEEDAYLSGSSAKGGAAADLSRRRAAARRRRQAQVAQDVQADASTPAAGAHTARPAHAARPARASHAPSAAKPVAANPVQEAAAVGGAAAALSAAAAELRPEAKAAGSALEAASGRDAHIPTLDDSASSGLDVIPLDFLDRLHADPASQPASTPETVRRTVPSVEGEPADAHEADEPVTCLFVDHQSGRTYRATAPSTIIGRERREGSIVLHDPNVSRTHAELSFADGVWRIKDLGSTNGTLVNDVDVKEQVLHDGDLVTIGLINLEFRES